MTNNSDHIFSNVDIRKLLIPIMLENLLASLMGTVDTMMVSNVGASAVSAVSSTAFSTASSASSQDAKSSLVSFFSSFPQAAFPARQ